MVETARIGVIGAGWWATDTHIPALEAHPNAELVALCDTDEERLHAAATQYDVPGIYTELDTLLAETELDGAIVVSSNASHYAAAKRCLEAGLDVMVEKPMTLYAADARELVQMAEKLGRQLIVGYPFNYTPFVRRAREVIQSGELGAIQYVDAIYNSYMTPFFTDNLHNRFTVHAPTQYTRPEQVGGGHGYVQITHGAGMLFSVTDLRPQRVFGLTHNHGLAIDLVDVMMVAFEGGALGTVSGTGNQKGLTWRLQINCEAGWLVIDVRAGTCEIHRNDADEPERIKWEPSSQPHPISYATGHNLVDVILGRAENGSPGDVGLRATELLDAGYRSAGKSGEPVMVDSLY